MSTAKNSPFLTWTFLVPIVAVVLVPLTWGRDIGPVVVIIVAALLAGAVLAAVHHAEVIAHKVGEPLGSLVLAVAVTVIEVGLIVTLMVAGGKDTSTLARDTVFAAVMITCNGIVGLSLFLGASKHRIVYFNAEGSGAALATVITLATLTLVLPTFTTSEPGPEFSPAQLTFAALASLALYAMFVTTQTMRHRDFFLPEAPTGSDDEHAPPPSNATAALSMALLGVALIAVVGLAKAESKAIEEAVAGAGLPHAFVGVVIALLVLLPESLAASRAALRNQLQVSLNLAYGSAIASIGLTIPAIALATIWLDGPLVLGLGSTEMILLGLTVVLGMLTVVPGRALRLQGGLHLIVMAAFIFLAIAP